MRKLLMVGAVGMLVSGLSVLKADDDKKVTIEGEVSVRSAP